MVPFRDGTTSSNDTDYRYSCSSGAASNLHGDESYLRPATVRTSSTNTGAASASYDRSASNGVPDDGTDAASSIDASSGADAAGSID